VFQPPQSGQRPTHRSDEWPQDWQEKLVLAFNEAPREKKRQRPDGPILMDAKKE
jgi:hypothetical protein